MLSLRAALKGLQGVRDDDPEGAGCEAFARGDVRASGRDLAAGEAVGRCFALSSVLTPSACSSTGFKLALVV